MIIRDVVGKEKMVISVANLNIDVSNLCVHIMDKLMAEITHGIVKDRQPTYKLALVSLLCHSRPIFSLLFSRKTRLEKNYTEGQKMDTLYRFRIYEIL